MWINANCWKTKTVKRVVMIQRDNTDFIPAAKYSVTYSTKSFKNTKQVVESSSELKNVFRRRPQTFSMLSFFGFLTQCALSFGIILLFCARWAIWNMVTACWAAAHTLSSTLPHVARLPVTRLILYTSFQVLVTKFKTFHALSSVTLLD